MLKGNLSSYLDPHNEEESSYVTLSNGPYVYVTDSANTEPKSDHDLVDVYFLTPILCKHCEDYVWGTGKVGVKCKAQPAVSFLKLHNPLLFLLLPTTEPCHRTTQERIHPPRTRTNFS
ncbi:uncharacterized protein LOC116433330 [Nomia melanderi]|uniref:uncharacterized protein LOC116433330 n=1 Tax=Nomia melanderi TaxID=2448451 RepID=UPI003FCE50E1